MHARADEVRETHRGRTHKDGCPPAQTDRVEQREHGWPARRVHAVEVLRLCVVAELAHDKKVCDLARHLPRIVRAEEPLALQEVDGLVADEWPSRCRQGVRHENDERGRCNDAEHVAPCRLVRGGADDVGPGSNQQKERGPANAERAVGGESVCREGAFADGQGRQRNEGVRQQHQKRHNWPVRWREQRPPADPRAPAQPYHGERQNESQSRTDSREQLDGGSERDRRERDQQPAAQGRFRLVHRFPDGY